MSDEYVHVGSHADILASARNLGPGERVSSEELDLTTGAGDELHVGQDQHLIDEGVLVDVNSFEGESNADAVKEAADREEKAKAENAAAAAPAKPQAPAANTTTASEGEPSGNA